MCGCSTATPTTTAYLPSTAAVPRRARGLVRTSAAAGGRLPDSEQALKPALHGAPLECGGAPDRLREEGVRLSTCPAGASPGRGYQWRRSDRAHEGGAEVLLHAVRGQEPGRYRAGEGVRCADAPARTCGPPVAPAVQEDSRGADIEVGGSPVWSPPVRRSLEEGAACGARLSPDRPRHFSYLCYLSYLSHISPPHLIRQKHSPTHIPSHH
mmetsp:Transcript_28326/g.62760  ORF Transcript_28326/g.62760 Transcript_28326/m.62760 type:complete len:211 (+) Transcript_28326:401-1033(+)